MGPEWVTSITLSRASEAGSPTNRSGSDKTWGQGSFGPSTGGPDLQGSLQHAEITKTPHDLLRQGKPGTSQYIAIIVGPSAAAFSGAQNSDFPQRKSALNRYWKWAGLNTCRCILSTLSQRINYSTWNSNLNPYSTWNSNLSLVFNLEFQFQWG